MMGGLSAAHSTLRGGKFCGKASSIVSSEGFRRNRVYGESSGLLAATHGVNCLQSSRSVSCSRLQSSACLLPNRETLLRSSVVSLGREYSNPLRVLRSKRGRIQVKIRIKRVVVLAGQDQNESLAEKGGANKGKKEQARGKNATASAKSAEDRDAQNIETSHQGDGPALQDKTGRAEGSTSDLKRIRRQAVPKKAGSKVQKQARRSSAPVGPSPTASIRRNSPRKRAWVKAPGAHLPLESGPAHEDEREKSEAGQRASKGSKEAASILAPHEESAPASQKESVQEDKNHTLQSKEGDEVLSYEKQVSALVRQEGAFTAALLSERDTLQASSEVEKPEEEGPRTMAEAEQSEQETTAQTQSQSPEAGPLSAEDVAVQRAFMPSLKEAFPGFQSMVEEAEIERCNESKRQVEKSSGAQSPDKERKEDSPMPLPDDDRTANEQLTYERRVMPEEGSIVAKYVQEGTEGKSVSDSEARGDWEQDASGPEEELSDILREDSEEAYKSSDSGRQAQLLLVSSTKEIREAIEVPRDIEEGAKESSTLSPLDVETAKEENRVNSDTESERKHLAVETSGAENEGGFNQGTACHKTEDNPLATEIPEFNAKKEGAPSTLQDEAKTLETVVEPAKTEVVTTTGIESELERQNSVEAVQRGARSDGQKSAQESGQAPAPYNGCPPKIQSPREKHVPKILGNTSRNIRGREQKTSCHSLELQHGSLDQTVLTGADSVENSAAGGSVPEPTREVALKQSPPEDFQISFETETRTDSLQTTCSEKGSGKGVFDWDCLTDMPRNPEIEATVQKAEKVDEKDRRLAKGAATNVEGRADIEAKKPESLAGRAVIKVIGVGGGGCNAVDRMVQAGLSGVTFWAVNTDAQQLRRSRAEHRLQIGRSITQGKGSGGNTQRAQLATESHRKQLEDAVKDADLVFIAAGLGGGVGTGVAPILGKMAKAIDALTVGIVTEPFAFEGSKRAAIARAGIEALRASVDTLVVVPNERLMEVITQKTLIEEAFRLADDVLRQGVQGISDIITSSGLVNVDLADVRAIMKDAGDAVLGVGEGSGPARARTAAARALGSPLQSLEGRGAPTGVIYNLTSGSDLTLQEMTTVADTVAQFADPSANIIFGAVIDDAFKNKMRMTIISTGFKFAGDTGEDFEGGGFAPCACCDKDLHSAEGEEVHRNTSPRWSGPRPTP